MWSLVQLASVIAVRRIISNWRLEMFLLLGIVLAVALMSSGVVFSDLLSQSALRRALDDASPEEANFYVRAFNNLDDPARAPRGRTRYQADADVVERAVGAPFEPYLEDRSLVLETSTFLFQGHPQLELDDEVRPRGKFKYLAGLAPGTREQGSLVRMEAGRWPRASAGPGEPVEVAIDRPGLGPAGAGSWGYHGGLPRLGYSGL